MASAFRKPRACKNRTEVIFFADKLAVEREKRRRRRKERRGAGRKGEVWGGDKGLVLHTHFLFSYLDHINSSLLWDGKS